MATYYVRKTGSDSNGGTDPDTDAVLTIGKGEDLATTAGDTVWIGHGVYREKITHGFSGSSGGGNISFMADIDGAQTGDAGLVIVTAWDTELGTVARTACVEPNDKEFVTWDGVTFIGGSTAVVHSATATNIAYEGCVWNDCNFLSGPDYNDYCVFIDFNDGATPTADGPQFTGCQFTGGNSFIWDLNASANRDRKILFENCEFDGFNPQSHTVGSGLSLVQGAGSGTFGSVGITINNCTISNKRYAVYADTTVPASAITVKNCEIRYCYTGLNDADSVNADAIVSDYNTFTVPWWTQSYVNVTAGGNDRTTASDGLRGGHGDRILYKRLGWSPYLPGEPIRFQDDSYVNGVIGDAQTSTAAATDHYGNPRPMHGTVDDRGAVEGRARPEKETTTVRTGSNSMRFEGAGFHDFFVPVAAQSTTITIYGRYDSSYTGSLPKMEVLDIPGVADKSDTMVAAANTWEQLSSAAFTPTAAGVCRVRISSQDTSASGESFFDDLVVT